MTKSILLVTSEPQPSSRQALSDLGMIRVSSAAEAAATETEASYDLVVVDDPPSTVELVERFHDRYPKLPIVVLNSGRSWEWAREAWRAGATDVVNKELDAAELAQAVKQILGLSERSILFVDDDLEILDAWTKLLHDNGYSVATASSSAAALEALSDQSFGLAVVDVRLDSQNPADRSGLRVAEAASRHDVTTIVLTGEPSPEKLREAMHKSTGGNAAAVDFVSKGEGFSALLARIEIAFKRMSEH